MADPVVARIRNNPKFAELQSKRNSFGWILTLLMMVVYFGYILLIAFNKPFLGTKVSPDAVMSIGIPMGLGVLVFTIIITIVYVRRANSEFDALNEQIIAEATK